MNELLEKLNKDYKLFGIGTFISVSIIFVLSAIEFNEKPLIVVIIMMFLFFITGISGVNYYAFIMYLEKKSEIDIRPKENLLSKLENIIE